jgi:hypothetical protein
MERVRNFYVTSDTFNVVRIYITGRTEMGH